MPGSSGRRKYKIERRRRMTSEQTLSTLMGLCRRHGMNVVNPQDLPEVFSVVLEQMSRSGNEIEIETPPENEIAMISDEQYQLQEVEEEEPAASEDEEEVHQITDGLDLGLSDPEPEPEPEEAFFAPDAPQIGWEMDAKDLFTPPRRAPAPAAAKSTPAPKQAARPATAAPAKPKGVNPEMIAQAQAKQAQVMQRVAEKGIQYRNAPGPSQGKKVAPHPSVADKVRKELSKTKAPVRAAPAQEEEEEEQSSSSADNSYINPKTGLSLKEQRDIVRRVTGKAPQAPKGGMPNLLKT